MISLSQNNKIAISAIVIFLVSFSVMFFFLKINVNDDFSRIAQTDVIHGANHSDATVAEGDATQEVNPWTAVLADNEDPSFVIDFDGHFQYADKAFCELLDVKCEKLMGSLLFDYINTDDLSEMVSAENKIIRDHEKIDLIGPLRLLKGDEEILLLLSAESVLNDEEKVEYIIFSARDITEQVENLQKEDEYPWIHHAYPKIKDALEDENRFMVEKIGFAE